MSTTTKKASARSCSSGALEAQITRQGNSDEKHDSTSTSLYKILHEPFFHLLPVEAGANSTLILGQAIPVLRKLDACGFPKPMCIDFTDDAATVLCGKQFAIEKYLDPTTAPELRAAMEATGVNCVSIMSVGDPHCPTISFGRNGVPEFVAYVVRGGE